MCFFLQNFQRINDQFEYIFQNDFGESGNASAISQQFSQHFGWIYNAKLVSEFENIKLDDVYSLPVLQFLNDLQYLKMKRKVDEDEQKRITNANKNKIR